MNSIFGRNTVPHKRLFLLPLAILILLGYSSTTIDFANVAIAQDYNEDNFNQGDESMVVSTSNSGTDEDSSMNDNLDENTNNQGLSGDSETGTNDNIDGSTYAQNDNSSSNENSSNGQEDVGSQDATTNKKLPPRAEAGSDIVTYEGDTVVLNGEKSSDDDDEIRSYHWLQIEGPEQITLRNVDTSFPTFQAPSVSSETKFRFELTVTDNDELSDTDSVDVTVSDRLIDAQQLSTDDNIQNIESSTDNSTFFNPQQNNGTIDSEREGTQILENNDSRGTINESTEQQISSQDSKVVSDGLVEEALNDMSNTGDVPSNETIELFTPQNSNHDESGAVDSNLSSTFEHIEQVR